MIVAMGSQTGRGQKELQDLDNIGLCFVALGGDPFLDLH